MRRMKRMLSLLLVLCMVFAMVPSFAAAAETSVVPVATFEDKNGTVTTFGYKDDGDGTYSTTKNGVVETTYDDYAEADYGTKGTKDRAVMFAFVLAMKEAATNAYSGTVTMYEDVKLIWDAGNDPFGITGNSAMFLDNTSIVANLVLNLNGHALDASGGQVGQRFAYMRSGDSLTINGGIGGAGTGSLLWPRSPFYGYNGGTDGYALTFNGVNLVQTNSLQAFVQLRYPNGTCTFNGGTLTAPAIVSVQNTTTDASNVTIELKNGFTFTTNGGTSSLSHVNSDGTVAIIVPSATTVNVGEATFNLEKGGDVARVSTTLSTAHAINLIDDAQKLADEETTLPDNSVGVKYTFSVPTYAVETNAIGNGTVTASKEMAAQGNFVMLHTDAEAGYMVDTVTVEKAGGTVDVQKVDSKTYTFVMPAEAVTVTVTFKDIPYYDVKIGETANGTVTPSKTTAAEGDTVTLDIQPNDLYVVDTVTVAKTEGTVDVTEVDSKTYTFVMPGEAVDVTVTFRGVPEGSHKVAVNESVNGTVTADKDYVLKDETVILTVTPDTGYEVEKVAVKTADDTEVSVSQGNNEDKYTFTMPDEEVTVTATFKVKLGDRVVSYIDANGTIDYHLAEIDAPNDNAYTSVELAFDAAYDKWVANGGGKDAATTPEIHVYEDLEVTMIYGSGSTTAAVLSVAGGKLLIDLHDNTLSNNTAENSAARDIGFIGNTATNNTFDITIQNATVNWGSTSRYFLQVGTTSDARRSGTATLNNLTFTGAARLISYSCTLTDVTLNGGTYNLGKFTLNDLQTNITNVNAAPVARAAETKFHLTGGVQINTSADYLVALPANGHLYVDNAVIKTSSNLDTKDSGLGIAKVVTSVDDGTFKTSGVPLTLGTEEGASAAISGTLNAPDTYNGKTVYTKTIKQLGSGTEQEDSVAMVGSTYYNLSDLQDYMANAEDNDEIVAIKDFGENGTVLKSSANVTYLFGEHKITADFEASGNITIKGGTITLSKPITLNDGAVMTVKGGTIIDASNTDAAVTGNGAIVFKDCAVKFKTETNPYDGMDFEGDSSDSVEGDVTIRTFTVDGDPEQGENTALLVESERYFATLAEAVADASELTAETVQLVADIDSEALTLSKDITIDLGGFQAITEFTVTDGEVVITNGTVASAAGDAITVNGGDVLISGVTAASTMSAVVINSASSNVEIIDSKLTGDSDRTDGAYALDIQAAASVWMDNVTMMTGAANTAPVRVGESVAYEVVTMNSGLVYTPKAYYDGYRTWAEGQGKISMQYTDERYAHNVDIVNAAGTSSKNSCYEMIVTAPAAETNMVAKISGTEYSSLEEALFVAADNNSSDSVVLLANAIIEDAAVLSAGDTLDLDGKTLTFGTVGTLELNGEIVTNGGSIESNGQVAVKSGASIDGYTFNAEAVLNTKLNLQAVSLSLNEYVDINLKYSESETAGFNTIKVTASGKPDPLDLAKTANGYKVYKIEDLKTVDYVTSYWVIMSANSGNDACVGMPVQVSVKEYAKRVVADETNYGYSSSLGKTMTAMMDYANIAAEFPGREHTNDADFGTTAATSNDVLSVAGDFTNGFALKVTSTTAGVLRITHTDVYGAPFVQDLDVTDGGTVTYTMMHVADAKQTVTITLLVNGAEASKLETTLASAAANEQADKAIIFSNMAEKLFDGN